MSYKRFTDDREGDPDVIKYGCGLRAYIVNRYLYRTNSIFCVRKSICFLPLGHGAKRLKYNKLPKKSEMDSIKNLCLTLQLYGDIII